MAATITERIIGTERALDLGEIVLVASKTRGHTHPGSLAGIGARDYHFEQREGHDRAE